MWFFKLKRDFIEILSCFSQNGWFVRISFMFEIVSVVYESGMGSGNCVFEAILNANKRCGFQA